jgi:hypothetical protein
MAKRSRRKVPRYLQALLDWKKPATPGRIKADLSQQAPNNSYGPPEYYEDQEFACRDCGIVGVWTAEQQQWWYEVAKGPVFSGAVRCRECRQKKRASHGGTPRRSQAELNREKIAKREARSSDQVQGN